MHTFIENYLHFMKNCIRPHYEKLKPLKSGFIENSNFENNRDPCPVHKVNGILIFLQAIAHTVAPLCNMVINVQPNPIELVLLHYVSWSRYGGKVIQGILNGRTSLCLDSRQSLTRWHDQDQHRASLQRDRHGGEAPGQVQL